MSFLQQHEIGAIHSILYQVIKFPNLGRRLVIELYGGHIVANHNNFIISGTSDAIPLNKYDLQINYVAKMPVDQTEYATKATRATTFQPKRVNIGTEEKLIMINVGFDPNKSIDGKFLNLFKMNKELFSLSYNDLPRIDPTIVSNELHVHVNCKVKPVKKKSRKLVPT